jgi:hypothetical protein
MVACSTFLRVTISALASSSSTLRAARGDTVSIRWTVRAVTSVFRKQLDEPRDGGVGSRDLPDVLSASPGGKLFAPHPLAG